MVILLHTGKYGNQNGQKQCYESQLPHFITKVQKESSPTLFSMFRNGKWNFPAKSKSNYWKEIYFFFALLLLKNI